jgi:hypothetical protein
VNEDLARAANEKPNESPFFVDNQVIVIGPESNVKDVSAVSDLELIKKCDFLDEISDQEEPQQRYFPFSDDARDQVTMRLYYISSGESVTDVVNLINEQGNESGVYADRNLLLGHSVCGDPNSMGGSPFESPQLLPVGEQAAVKLFWEQWAFEQVDVGPAFKNKLAGAAIMHQGEGVLVGVFDTLPFRDPWDDMTNGNKDSVLETQEIVKWVNPTMDVEQLALKILYPFMGELTLPKEYLVLFHTTNLEFLTLCRAEN